MITNSLNCPSMPDTITDVALRKGCFSEVHGQGIACFPKPGNLYPAFTSISPSQRASNLKPNFVSENKHASKTFSFQLPFRSFSDLLLIFSFFEGLNSWDFFRVFFQGRAKISWDLQVRGPAWSVVMVVKDNYGHHMIQFEFSPKKSVWRIPPSLPLVAPKWRGWRLRLAD